MMETEYEAMAKMKRDYREKKNGEREKLRRRQFIYSVDREKGRNS